MPDWTADEDRYMAEHRGEGKWDVDLTPARSLYESDRPEPEPEAPPEVEPDDLNERGACCAPTPEPCPPGYCGYPEDCMKPVPNDFAPGDHPARRYDRDY